MVIRLYNSFIYLYIILLLKSITMQYDPTDFFIDNWLRNTH
jgi:hypothetical protein